MKCWSKIRTIRANLFLFKLDTDSKFAQKSPCDMNVNNSWLEEANALLYCKSPHQSGQLEPYSSPYAGRGCSSISAPLPPKQSSYLGASPLHSK